MTIYKYKLLIPCVPIAVEWTVSYPAANIRGAAIKAIAEMKIRGLEPIKKAYEHILESEILSVQNI